MATWIDQKNAIVADAVYVDNELAARDVSVSLPEVSFQTADINAMGTMTFPLAGLLDDMEMTVSKAGTDLGLFKMCTPGKHSMEVRYVQNSIAADGTSTPEGCKAFLTVFPKTIPEIAVEVGASGENEVSFTVSRFQLYVNGEEMLCIDRLNSICRIRGTDYYSQIAKYL